jgi:hypothetical protein
MILMPKKDKTPFRLWLDSQPRGTMSAIATRLDVSRQYIYDVAEGKKTLSHSRALRLSSETGLGIKKFLYSRTVFNVPE